MTNPYQQQPAPQYGGPQYAPQQPYPPQQQPYPPQQQPYPPQGQPPQYPGQQYGQQPGWGPQGGVYEIRLTRHTGAVIWWQQSRRTVTGSFEQIEQEYKSAQTHNLTLGWWSISSIIIYNWIAIFGNMINFNKVKKSAGR